MTGQDAGRGQAREVLGHDRRRAAEEGERRGATSGRPAPAPAARPGPGWWPITRSTGSARPAGGRPAAQRRARRALPQPSAQRVPLGARGGGAAQRGERRGVRGLEDEVRGRAARRPRAAPRHAISQKHAVAPPVSQPSQRMVAGCRGDFARTFRMSQAPVSSPCPATHRAIAGATSSITTTRSTCTATTNATSTPGGDRRRQHRVDPARGGGEIALERRGAGEPREQRAQRRARHHDRGDQRDGRREQPGHHPQALPGEPHAGLPPDHRVGELDQRRRAGRRRRRPR